MKRTTLLLATLLMLAVAASCDKDTIIETDAVATDSDTESGDDNLDSVSIDNTVTVVYGSSGATVSGTSDSVTASVSGNGVTITNRSSQVVNYQLSGTSDNGFFKLYSGKKQVVTLNGLSLANPNGAVINIQGLPSSPSSGKRAFVVVQGTNTLADGSSYSATPSTEDEKAALFSEGKLVFSGSGTLTVTASGKAGITSDDYVHFQSGTYKVTSTAGHGVRGKDYILVSGGTLDVSVSAAGKKGFSSDSLVRFDGGETTIAVTGNTVVESGDTSGTAGIKADVLFEMNSGSLTITNSGTGGKGISCDGMAYFRGGEVTITVTGNNFGSSSGGGGGWGPGGGWGNQSDNSVGAKGIKCDGNIEISGGTITVTASKHEGIETKGTLTVSGGQVYSQSSDDAINSASTMTISGGFVCAYSTGNDGLDANGNLYLKGGVVYAIGSTNPEVALDANTEGGYKLYVQSGATLIAIGALESGAQLSQSCYQSSTWSRNTWYSMTVGDNTYAFKTPASGGSKLVVSGTEQPVLKSGVTVSGGTAICNGMLNVSPSVSGGSSVSLSNYSSGGGGWH